MPLTRKQRSTTKDRSTTPPPAHDVYAGTDTVERDGNHETSPFPTYIFDGVAYSTYQEMVNAKRKRNDAVLHGLGLATANKNATQRGIKKQKIVKEPLPRRKSNRLSSEKSPLVALDYNVNAWNRNTSVVQVEGGDPALAGEDAPSIKPAYHKGRLNDGSDFTIEEAVQMIADKWVKDDTVELATKFVSTTLKDLSNYTTPRDEQKRRSPTSVATTLLESSLTEMVNRLSIDNEEWVAKVTNDRIYSVEAHPSEEKLIACAGDKWGYIGLWDVDASTEDNNGVNLFRVHSRAVCGLQWATSDTMISASYDGTVRRLDVETGKFQEIFATYDDSDTSYAEDLGFGLDEGHQFWHQHVSLDHRYSGSSNPCLFLATSIGKALHLDLRIANKERVTFNEKLSDKKINTLSLHPNGYTLASAGNDGVVNLWDVRKFQGSPYKAGTPKAIASHSIGLSVSSSFFSPSGNSLLSTSFSNKLDLIGDPDKQKGDIKPVVQIPHNNQTGRWLSTFMASWHAKQNIFVCGSMKKPRCVEIFDEKGKLLREVSGDSLTAVASRCCFHPSTSRLIVIGGNSSGRMIVIR